MILVDYIYSITRRAQRCVRGPEQGERRKRRKGHSEMPLLLR
jgi:hypothetical protein